MEVCRCLLYHRFEFNDVEYRYHTTLGKDICDKYKKEFEAGNGTHGHPVHMDVDMIENWYPKTFSERIDYILMYINAHTPHIGQEIAWNFPEMLGALFVDRYEIDKSYPLTNSIKQSPRDEDDCTKEAEYILKYLASNSYIEYTNGPDTNEAVVLTLAPDGYKRVDELLKNTSYGHSALVAMKFGEDTYDLREAIRKGIASAGYVAIFKENKKRPVRTPPTPFSQPVPQMQYKSKNFSILNDSTVCLKISTCMLDAPEMQAASFWWLGAFLHFVGEDPPLS